MEVCVDKKNMGLSKCAKLPNMPKCMITTPMNFKATEEEAVDVDFWQDAMLADKSIRIYPWPLFFDFKDNSEKAVYQSTPLGVRAVRDGRYDFEFDISENLCLHKAMFTHRSVNSQRVFLIDVDNQMLGTTDTDGNFQGAAAMMVHTEKLMISNGTVATQSPVRVVLADNLDYDKNGALLDASFFDQLIRLTDVTITVESSIATKVVVKVVQTCDGTPVIGFVVADFVLTETDGTPQTITTVTDNGDGTYDLNGTALVSGFVNLVLPADLTIQAYESTGKATVTIA